MKFYGIASPLFCIIGFIAATANPAAGAVFMLAAILFHLWSQEDPK